MSQPEPPALPAILAATAAHGFNMASDRLTGALLRVLAASKPGGAVLELGTGTGVASAWLLSGMNAAASLVSVERDAAAQAIARRHLAHDRRATFHAGDAAAFLGDAQRAPARFDLIFADTWPGKYTHLDLALGLLKPGGLYVIDDMIPRPTWPAEHAPRAAALLADLERRANLLIAGLDWASGVVIATRSRAPSPEEQL